MKKNLLKNLNSLLKLNLYAKIARTMMPMVIQRIEVTKLVKESKVSYWKVMDHLYFA